MIKTVAMTGGGTGGHLAIVKAVKERMEGMDAIYIGSEGGQDRRWFGEDEEFRARYFLKTRGVVNQGIFGKILSLGMLAREVRHCLKIFREQEVGLVFSVGGYSAAPAAIAAILARIDLVIHEQNAAPGTLNRLLRPYAAAFLSSYEEESPLKAYPISSIFFEKARVRGRIRKLLFLGGSQGAQAINNLALQLAPELRRRGIGIIHQAGERNLEQVRDAYAQLGIEAEVFGFSDRIPEYMAQADLAVARAGASSMWELAANGLPALFVPYPHAAGDHQYHNAKFLADRGLGWVVRQKELKPEHVLDLLDRDLEPVSRGLIEYTPRKGAAEIARFLKEKAEG